jgi:sec-independent protein translocase protein TatA
MFGIGTQEMLLFGIIAVILFGSRLPSVARSLGKSIVEFKKGMHDLESEVKTSVYSEPAGRVGYSDHSEPSAPRFEPPKA